MDEIKNHMFQQEAFILRRHFGNHEEGARYDSVHKCLCNVIFVLRLAFQNPASLLVSIEMPYTVLKYVTENTLNSLATFKI
jgi:hypothetical protein